MNRNNPFAVHGINHLSHSSLNTWLQDPARFIADKLFGIRDKGSASMHRGTSTEFGLAQKYTEDAWEIDQQIVDQKFDQLCQDSLIDVVDERRIKEKQGLKEYNNILNQYFDYTDLEDYQKKIEVTFDDIPVPIIGYIDFIFKDIIVDLKTTARMPSKPTDANKRQMAIYSLAYPNYRADVFYASPKAFNKFIINEKEIKLHQKQIHSLAIGLMKFLAISDDKEELASIIHPNYDAWTWSEYMKEQSSKIIKQWSYE
tara:strand:+ start:270 stop:1040 length:771 start_codon:yes stop_codon:yes gene_type:complete